MNLAQAQDFPVLTGRVVDQADLLNPGQERALTDELEALEANSTRQLVVATVDSLQGYPIEDYGYQLGREWGIGQAANGDAEKDNGVILLVAPNERKVRIEVGYGLEPIMTDALASRIINDHILPRFREGYYPAGIITGTQVLVEQLSLPDDEARAIAARAESSGRKRNRSGNSGMLIFWLFILLVFVVPMFFSSRRKGRRYRGRGDAGPIIIWGGGGGGWGGGSSGGGFGGGGFGGGGFGGGGGGFGGGGASGGW
ncbi:TPM domain-containing protein [Alterisphingorhabdus coralli]|uniref:TPM domain-containing protein n=1 Tax=Alterisphingorhabdus coralli TaxID=3071408 RepID=A0AA97F5A2_9SPHN|nr:TPM domain-containing protein [Parasphingorhabdus sp. SCSIO 66989]WOE74266.1 TPM domain-containing protein [Parasphingorhabdus sp. SCSIO 66989]